MDLLELLRPKNVHRKKVRIGPPSDGGYVVPEIALQSCSALFTYGVGNDIGFEVEFVEKYNKPAYLFDHTVIRSNWNDSNLYFVNRGLGFSEQCGDICEHYERFGVNGNIYLKVDIEGDEYAYFLKADIAKIASITAGLSLEVHWIDEPQCRASCLRVLRRLQEYFTLCHIHGNNFYGDSGLWQYGCHRLAKVFELSFINKRLVEKEEEEDISVYPIKGLDMPNTPGIPEYELSFLKTNAGENNG